MPDAAPSTRHCTSRACAHLTAALSRCDPQTQVAVHSWRTAPIRCSASVSISSCITIRTDARLRSTPSPGGLAHLRGDWVGKAIGALNPFGGTTPARSRAVGGSTTQLAAEAVVRAARALKRWAAIDVEKQTECHGGQTFAPRHSGGPCSPWVEGVADAVVGLQDRGEQAPLARSRRCLRRASALDRRVSDGDRLRTVGEPDPCARTSRRTRGTTT
jgi:hypothetical protein